MNPDFEFTDPPFRRPLPMTLAFAATASRSTALLTARSIPSGTGPNRPHPDSAAGPVGMVSARAEGCPFAVTAGLAWSGDLPRQLQQVLFDTADSITF